MNDLWWVWCEECQTCIKYDDYIWSIESSTLVHEINGCEHSDLQMIKRHRD